MGIKALLNKQDEGFISLHDLLMKMMQEDGVSLQDAATALYRILEATTPEAYPQWHEKSRAGGVRSTEEHQLACLRLREVVDSGSFTFEWGSDVPF